MAVGLLRAGLPDELWPDFSREAFRAALDEYDARDAPVRGALSDAPSHGAGAAAAAARGPARRRGGGSDLGARIARRGAGDRLRAGDRRAWAGLGLRGRRRRARPDLPARALLDVRARRPVAAGGLRRRRSRCWSPPRWATSETILLRVRGLRPAGLRRRRLQPGGGAGAPAMAVTMLGLAWIGLALRARGAAARPAPRRRDRLRRAGGDVHRRHRRLPRRARASAAGRWRRSISPNKTVEGLAIGFVIARRGGVVGGALPGLARRLPSARSSASRSRWRRRWATSSSPTSSATPTRRTPARSSAPTAARSIASTPAMFTMVVGFYVWLALT